MRVLGGFIILYQIGTFPVSRRTQSWRTSYLPLSPRTDWSQNCWFLSTFQRPPKNFWPPNNQSLLGFIWYASKTDCQRDSQMFHYYISFNEMSKRSKVDHLSLLASLSDSRRARTSPFLTGPFTFLTRVLLDWLRNLTLTWVIPPLDPMIIINVRWWFTYQSFQWRR